MKKFLVAAALFVTSMATQSAMASDCTAEMVARNGRVLDTFFAYDYNHNQACREALSRCHHEQNRRSYDRVVRNASCQVSYRRPDPRPVKERCSVNLVNTNNGRVVDTFTAQGNNQKRACEKADNKCFDARYTKNNPWKFACEKVRGGRPGPGPGPRPKPIVTKFCSFDRIANGRFGGRVVQTYTSSARGVQGSGVKARACTQARSECARDARISGRRDTCMKRN